MIENNKKTILVVLLIALLSMTAMVGCGGGSSDDGAGTGDYMEWSGAEWEKASEDEKAKALTALFQEIQPDIMEDEETLNATIEQMIPLFDDMFEQEPKTTLGELAKATEDYIVPEFEE